MIRPRWSYSNLWTKYSRTLMMSTGLLTCKRKLRRKRKNAYAVSLKYWDILATSTPTIAEMLFTVRNARSNTFFTGCSVVFLTCKERHTQPSSLCLCRSQTSLCTTKTCETPSKSTRTCRQSSRQCTPTQRLCVRRAWTRLSSKKRSLS